MTDHDVVLNASKVLMALDLILDKYGDNTLITVDAMRKTLARALAYSSKGFDMEVALINAEEAFKRGSK